MAFKAPARSVIVLILALAMVACGPVVRTRGSLLTDDVVARVDIGRSTTNDVAVQLGPPSSISTFDPNVWYYVGERTEKRAFLEPEVVVRRVIRITFDPSGLVQSVDELGLDDANEVLVVERETPTLGRQITFLEQLLGNLGRFNTTDN